jgi:ribonuclease BN (tRNA processing enzyme)
VLRLTILGCSGSYPGPDTACSGYLVEGGGVTIALDLGPGTLANLQHHIGLGDLDAVLLSHGHPDHWTDLAGLVVASKYVLGRQGVPVYGTTDTRIRAAAMMGDELGPTVDWRDVTDGDFITVGGLAIEFSATDHYVETLAMRITDGDRTLAYSADTGPGWSFDAFGGPAPDLALCEATTLAADQRDGFLHLSARQAGDMARAAGVGRLVLTHQMPGGDPDTFAAEGTEAFGAAVSVARVHDVFTV